MRTTPVSVTVLTRYHLKKRTVAAPAMSTATTAQMVSFLVIVSFAALSFRLVSVDEYSRRRLLKGLLGSACLPRGGGAAPENSPAPSGLSPEEDTFLDDLEKANYLFFWEQAHPATGLIKYRCNTPATDTGNVASVAGTGFGLTALCIAQQRGWVSLSEARARALTTLRF